MTQADQDGKQSQSKTASLQNQKNYKCTNNETTQTKKQSQGVRKYVTKVIQSNQSQTQQLIHYTQYTKMSAITQTRTQHKHNTMQTQKNSNITNGNISHKAENNNSKNKPHRKRTSKI